MYFLNLIGVLGLFWFQIGGCAPSPSHTLQKELPHEIPSGSQLLYMSYFNQDSGKFCPIPVMPPQEYLYYDKYFVNVVTRTIDNSMADRDSISHESITTRTISYSTDWYDLINLEKRKYTRYTSFSTSAVKSQEGTIEKRVNLDEFNDYSLAMSVVKDLSDTLVGSENFKRVLLKSDTGAANFVAYFKPIKEESPLQLSRILNAKYGATLVRLEVLYPSGDRVALEMKYKPDSLTEEQKKVIAQWIKNEN